MHTYSHTGLRRSVTDRNGSRYDHRRFHWKRLKAKFNTFLCEIDRRYFAEQAAFWRGTGGPYTSVTDWIGSIPDHENSQTKNLIAKFIKFKTPASVTW